MKIRTIVIIVVLLLVGVFFFFTQVNATSSIASVTLFPIMDICGEAFTHPIGTPQAKQQLIEASDKFKRGEC